MPIEASAAWDHLLERARARATDEMPLASRGTLTRLTGLVLEAAGLRMPVGAQCLGRQGTRKPVLAEGVGVSGEKAFLMPAGDIHGL